MYFVTKTNDEKHQCLVNSPQIEKGISISLCEVLLPINNNKKNTLIILFSWPRRKICNLSAGFNIIFTNKSIFLKLEVKIFIQQILIPWNFWFQRNTNSIQLCVIIKLHDDMLHVY